MIELAALVIGAYLAIMAGALALVLAGTALVTVLAGVGYALEWLGVLRR